MKQKMDNSIKITLIVVASVLVLALIGGWMYFRVNPSSTITVQGQATIEVQPDLVVTYFNVLNEAGTAEEAKNKNAETVDEVVSSLMNEGFAREEIQTQDFSVQPKYSWSGGQSRIVGYEARHTIKLEISTENIDKIGNVIDAGINAGANVNYINFELSKENQNKYKAEAIKVATEDARTKAEATAEGLGKSVGRVISVSSSEFGYYPWRVLEAGESLVSKDVATQIQPSDQEISASVSVIYTIY